MASNRYIRTFGRWKNAAHSHNNLFDAIRMECQKNGILTTTAKTADFKKWLVSELWSKYNEYYMELQNIAMKRMDSTPIVIANGTKGKPYVSQTIELPEDSSADYEFEGLDGTGLEVVRSEADNKFNIQGIPTETGDIAFKIKYKFNGWVEGQPVLEREIVFAINPDPRTLWKNIPTSHDVPYYKPDTDCEYVKVEAKEDGIPQKDIVAASNRGRSHAQEGKARDDHFQVFHCPDTDWYILAVADGAGSAKFSRKGSEVACKTVMDYCRKQLENSEEFEKAIGAYHKVKNDENQEPGARKAVGDFVYNIVGNAAYLAQKAIVDVSKKNEGSKPKDFATTLLLAICKKFDFGWFVGSFWVGDGAMCLYDKDNQKFTLLGTPDEGEYSGQTRFLTMPEIFTDVQSLYNRVRFVIKDDFTALMLMSDGVSDPMFGTDANLNNIDKWNEFWDKLLNGFPEDEIPGVDLSDDNEASKDQLLNWLNFWMPGEHDDRTIAILY